MKIDTTQIRNLTTGMEKGFLFGHYDSRGGAMLLIAESLPEACMAYNCQFEGVDYPAPHGKLMSDCSTEDLMEYNFDILVFGPWDPTNDADLLNLETWTLEKVRVFYGSGECKEKMIFIPMLFDVAEETYGSGCIDDPDNLTQNGIVRESGHELDTNWEEKADHYGSMFKYSFMTWGYGLGLGEDAYGLYYWKVPADKMFEAHDSWRKDVK